MSKKLFKILLISICALVLHPSSVFGSISITKAVLIDKDQGIPRSWGYADAGLSVYFEGDATCSCCEPSLSFEWYFDDGASANGKNVSHVYAGGSHYPWLCVKCSSCDDHEHSSTKSVYAISDIEIYRIGEADTNNRLCFNTITTCAAKAHPDCDLPSQASDLIDWSMYINYHEIEEANAASTNMDLPSANWPTSNSRWGSGRVLYSLIDSPDVSGQDDELITGSASYIGTMETLTAYYNATSYENPTSDRNWFYYYKDNEGSGNPYTYQDTATSSSTSGGGWGTVKIANDAYNGTKHLNYDYSNPGGRLKATSWGPTIAYYADFIGIVAHEGQHANNESPGHPTDYDGDDLKANFERKISLTNPYDYDSARGFLPVGWGDDEVYAAGPVEKPAKLNASTSNDWAQPGTNWE